jgi:YebC/PmpR family DNA-binding regulatory protein
MSGHSKWSSIKHKKGAADAKRGKIFTKIIKEICVAAKAGGGVIEDNPRLRTVVAEAKAQNMPKNNIERAIKKGTGELEGESYEEITYEGYGPSGVAVMVECLTENRNRAIADVRYIFGKAGGNVGTDGCVSWMFDKKGLITISKDVTDEETLMEIALEAGAEDIKDEGKSFDVITDPNDFDDVKQAIDNASITYEFGEVTMIPQDVVSLEGEDAEKMIKFMDALDDCDDVQKFYSNADIPDEAFDNL